MRQKALRLALLALAGLGLAVPAAAPADTGAPQPEGSGSFSLYMKTPLDGATISGRIVWEAGFVGTAPQRVEFYVDSSRRWTESWSPFVFNGDTGTLDTTTLQDGAHQLKVIGYRRGWTSASSVTVTVSNKRKPAPPVNTSPPTISGTAVVGQTLTGNAGSWSGTSPITFAYQWLGCASSSDPSTCSAISGATSTSYAVATGDVNLYLRLKVTASNSAGSASALSAATAQVTAPPPPPPSGLSVTTVDFSHIRLSWGAVANAVGYKILRDGLLVGTTSGTGTSFVDSMLWPQTLYKYQVDAISSSGSPLASLTGSSATALLPASGFPRPFPATSVWNTPIGNTPTVPNSGALVSYLVANALWPNLILRKWAISIAEADSADPQYSVPCTLYNPCSLGAFGPFPIPLTAAPDPSPDGHLVVYDPSAQRQWGMYQAVNSGGKWSASAGEGVSTSSGNGLPPSGTAGSNAANFPLLAGVVRPEELLQGRIDHALVFGMPGVSTLGHVCPATHNDGSSTDPNAPLEGMRFQLDPSINVDSLSIPAWEKTIARALQVYGMYLEDQGGTLSIAGENPISRGYDAWAKAGLPTGINSILLNGMPWDKFRVVQAPC